MNNINKRFKIIIVIIVLSISYIIIELYNIQVVNNEYYLIKAKELGEKIIEGSTAPRGKIYDRNNVLIVDNKAKKVIYYKNNSNDLNEEIALSYKINKYLTLDYNKLTINNLKDFYLVKYQKESNNLITEEEWNLLSERKLTNNDIIKLKKERITEETLKIFNEEDKKAAYVYYLMTNGYSYDEKIIKDKDVTDKEYANIAENIDKLNGFNTKLEWERIYPYNNTFKSILGNVSKIPSELKDFYINKGYDLNDLVGTSYLEFMYDDYLRGTKNTYIINREGKKLLEEGKRGNDLILTIDIKLQKEIETILTNEILYTKTEPNTEYFNKAYVIVSDPNTGEILAMAGKQYLNGKIVDYTPGIITSSVVPGSVVKGASQIVGYNTGALKINEYRDDSCIKIKSTPIKCSWQYLGYINDTTALALSSNTYQFNTAINVGKGYYYYDGPLSLDLNAYNTYRNTFKEFGLGTLTGIDLPNEKMGYIGKSTVSSHILDFAIGQYDTYTPIQLSQYINTIANGGNRIKPQLLKQVIDSSNKETIYIHKTKILNTVNTNKEYLNRVKEGLKAVIDWGTGYGFINPIYNAAGKTGTSQSFIDTNNDGAIDKETISTAFLAYAPYNNPKVSFTIITPDVSHYDNYNSYQSTINSRISNQVSKKYFDFYK